MYGAVPLWVTAAINESASDGRVMLKSMKKAIVVAVASAGAIAPAFASADQWYADGVLVGGTPGVAVAGGGSFSLTVNIGVPVTTACEVEVTADLFNQVNDAHGEVTSFSVANPMADCTVSGVSNCQITSFATTSMPWTIDTVGTTVTFTGVSFVYTYGRINPFNPCVLEGNRHTTGSVSGTWWNPAGGSPGKVTFTNAAGPQFGTLPTVVNGSIDFVGEAGEEITLY